MFTHTHTHTANGHQVYNLPNVNVTFTFIRVKCNIAVLLLYFIIIQYWNENERIIIFIFVSSKLGPEIKCNDNFIQGFDPKCDSLLNDNELQFIHPQNLRYIKKYLEHSDTGRKKKENQHYMFTFIR